TIEQSHTFTNPNTYSVSVVLTDDRGATSIACTQTVEVLASQTGTDTQPEPTPTQAVIAQPTTPPPIDPPGSLGTAMGVIGAIMLTVIGGLLFFAL
ncbi:MAG TPA: hypothetical protein PLD54_03975, partial [Candidatus Levybacteria bacterium]|nr:hypothetical protein [Candidatus Levybacteria bacterium]